MRKAILSLLFILFAAVTTFAQSTTVTSTITDAGSVAWANGSFTFTFNGPQVVTWPGGAFSRVVKGSLDSSGALSQSLPDNNTITPSPTSWTLQVCPRAGIAQACFTTAPLTITGATQSLTVTPPAIAIPGSSGLPIAAYADAEVVAPVPLGFIYYQPTSATAGMYRQCQAIDSVGNCTTWGNTGTGSGGPPTGAAGGDLSGTYPNPTVAKVDGVAYSASPSTHQTPVITAANTATYKTLPDCTDTAGNHLNYTQSSDSYSCGTSAGAASSVPFSGITGATNTTAAMVVGTGASLAATGSGTITATNGLSGLTTGFIPKAASASTATNSLCDEGITTANVLTCTDTGGLSILQALIGASPPSFTAGSGFAIAGTEGSAPTGATGIDIPYMDSTFHALATNNNNTGNMALSRTVCVNVTPVTVAANVTTDQNLQFCSLAANAVNVVGHTLKVTTAGVFSTNAASTASLTFKVKLCTVSGCGSGTVITPLNATTGATAALSATNLQFLESGYIVTQTAGAASSYEAQGSLTIDTSATATVSESIYPAVNTATVGTIDSTGALFIQVTAAASAGSTNNSFTGRQLIVELVN